MASYSAVIDLRVQGQGKIKGVNDQIQRLKDITRTLKPVPDLFQKARGGTDKTREKINTLKTTLKDTLNTFGQIGKATGFSKTIGGLNSQLSAFRQVSNSAKVGTNEFNKALIAGENASRQLLKAELERIRTLGNVYKSNAGVQLMGSGEKTNQQQITSLLSISNNLPKSISGLTTYRSELQRILEVVDIGSKEFNELQVAIEKVNVAMGNTGFSANQYGPQQKKTGKTGGTGRFGRIIQSAGIGGGFPLLFGGGPISAAAGLVGGGLGEAISPRGGFAGSIAATALVSQVQQAVTEVGKLGQALNPATKNIEALTASLGIVGTEFDKQLKTLTKLGNEEAAFEAARQRMVNLVGQNGVDALTDFGKGVTELGNDFTKIMTQMKASLASFLEGSGIGRFISNRFSRTALLGQAENTDSKKIQNLITVRKELQNPFTLPGTKAALAKTTLGLEKKSFLVNDEDIKAAIKRINDLIIEEQKLLNIKFEQTEADEMIKKIQESRIENIDEQIALLNKSLGMSSDEFEIEKQIADLKKDGNLQDEQSIRNKLRELQILEKQKATQKEIENILSSGMTDAVMGLIEGSKTLGQVLAGVARQLASMFLNRAFSSMFGGILGGGNSNAVPNVSTSSSSFDPFKTGLFYEYANGGYVNSPTMGLVGEAGEPEYVIPSSKMSGAMARYSAGARGGAVIPGGSGASGTVAGSSGNTIVEYTGPVLNFNGDEYVPKSAVPEIINTAAKRGGESGRAQAFSALKNSRSQRATLGL